MTSSKKRLAALLLCLFLGAFGAHRFYVGKTSSAIVQLLLTLSIVGIYVTGIWAFIDFLLIATGTFKDREGAVVKNWE